jgi:DNA-binding transcriptional MerR regulator
MKLTDLIEAIADQRVTPRFVRFLIAEGVIPPPTGGRAHAEYASEHVEGIARYLRLRDLGLSVAAIKRLDESAALDAVAVELAPGLTLAIRTGELLVPFDPTELAARIIAVIADITSPTQSASPKANTTSKRTQI